MNATKQNIRCVVETKKCTGCSCCLSSCPFGAIHMTVDSEGFNTPEVDEEKCQDCGICIQKCPEFSAIERYSEKNGRYYIAQSKIRKESKRSASGGAFYTIAKYVIEELRGVAIGAAFTEEHVVRHICVDNIRDLRKLQNSKYVQSSIGEIFSVTKELLSDGRYVFFTGTPCQVAGIKKFIGDKHDNLITADIICHGVPSPKLLAKQIEQESHTRKGSVKSVQFRYKNPVFDSGSSFYMIIGMKRGLPIVRRPADDPFFNIFSKGIGFRESCYDCRYANTDRVGDFTLGDCDSHRLYPDFHPNESNSTIMLNSDRAKKMWENALAHQFDFTLLDITQERKYNKQLDKPALRPDERDFVYNDLDNLPWTEFCKKYSTKQTSYRKMRAYMALLMPPFILNLLNKGNG